ncbi:MAG: DUF1385 domain-containing protein [Eubacteriales bacterium]|jgi:uncharacterized protein YqhQ
MNKQSCTKKTSIGGQAVIEGVMMRGPRKTSVVVRKKDGTLERDLSDTYKEGKIPWYTKVPFVRGIFNLGSSLYIGYKALNFSASFFVDEEEEEPGRFEKWLSEKLGDRLNDALMTFSMVLGVGLSVVLFFMLPTLITGLIQQWLPNHVVKALTEGLVRILIFLGYLAGVSLMEDIRRVYMYHGAEHKTIACYEAGEELTVENVRKYTRFHPRCGTSFLLIVMVVSILVFSFLSWNNVWIRLLLRILLIPVVVGISYEIIKLAGRYDNPVTRAVSRPGLWLQRLTTREPEDSMIEVAIAAMKDVIPEQEGEDRW